MFLIFIVASNAVFSVMRMNGKDGQPGDPGFKNFPSPEESEFETITLKVPCDLSRAFHRCTWILVNESNRSQLDIMKEVVEDFLVKHGC